MAEEYLREPNDAFPGDVWATATEYAATKPPDADQILERWVRFAYWDDEFDALFLGELDERERARIHRELSCAAEEIIADEQRLPTSRREAD